MGEEAAFRIGLFALGEAPVVHPLQSLHAARGSDGGVGGWVVFHLFEEESGWVGGLFLTLTCGLWVGGWVTCWAISGGTALVASSAANFRL